MRDGGSRGSWCPEATADSPEYNSDVKLRPIPVTGRRIILWIYLLPRDPERTSQLKRRREPVEPYRRRSASRNSYHARGEIVDFRDERESPRYFSRVRGDSVQLEIAAPEAPG